MDKIPRIILIIATFSLLLGFISAMNFYQGLEEQAQKNKEKKTANKEQVLEKEAKEGTDIKAGSNEPPPAITLEKNMTSTD